MVFVQFILYKNIDYIGSVKYDVLCSFAILAYKMDFKNYSYATYSNLVVNAIAILVMHFGL